MRVERLLAVVLLLTVRRYYRISPATAMFHNDKQLHHLHDDDVKQVRCMVFTASDSRTVETDEGGAYLVKVLGELGHSVLARRVVADDAGAIRALVLDAVESGDIDVLIVNGGTGIAPRDVTPEAVIPLFTKHLPGFGELFRQLFFAQHGAEAVLSRADAGVVTRTLVFMLPGSPQACRLAMDQLIRPILGHAVGLLHPKS